MWWRRGCAAGEVGEEVRMRTGARSYTAFAQPQPCSSSLRTFPTALLLSSLEVPEGTLTASGGPSIKP